MKKILIILICLMIFIPGIFSKNIEIPNNVKIIGLNSATGSLFITAIDLSNNEIIIFEYFSKSYITTKGNGTIINTFRTGIIVNPNDYKTVALNNKTDGE